MKAVFTFLGVYFLCLGILMGQEFTISGVVKDATTLELLDSVRVIISSSNSSSETTTNSNGEFKSAFSGKDLVIILRKQGYMRVIDSSIKLDSIIIKANYDMIPEKNISGIPPIDTLTEKQEVKQQALVFLQQFQNVITTLTKKVDMQIKEDSINKLLPQVDAGATIEVCTVNKNDSLQRLEMQNVDILTYQTYFNQRKERWKDKKVYVGFEKDIEQVFWAKDGDCYTVEFKYKQDFESKNYADLTVKITAIKVCKLKSGEWSPTLLDTRVVESHRK